MNFGTIDTSKIDLRSTYYFSDIVRTFKISRSTLEMWRARGILKVHHYQQSSTRGAWLINAIRNKPRPGQRTTKEVSHGTDAMVRMPEL